MASIGNGSPSVSQSYTTDVSITEKGNLQVKVKIGDNEHTFEDLTVRLGGKDVSFKGLEGKDLGEVAAAVKIIYKDKIKDFIEKIKASSADDSKASFGDHKFSSRVDGNFARDTKLTTSLSEKSVSKADAAMTLLLHIIIKEKSLHQAAPASPRSPIVATQIRPNSGSSVARVDQATKLTLSSARPAAGPGSSAAASSPPAPQAQAAAKAGHEGDGVLRTDDLAKDSLVIDHVEDLADPINKELAVGSEEAILPLNIEGFTGVDEETDSEEDDAATARAAASEAVAASAAATASDRADLAAAQAGAFKDSAAAEAAATLPGAEPLTPPIEKDIPEELTAEAQKGFESEMNAIRRGHVDEAAAADSARDAGLAGHAADQAGGAATAAEEAAAAEEEAAAAAAAAAAAEAAEAQAALEGAREGERTGGPDPHKADSATLPGEDAPPAPAAARASEETPTAIPQIDIHENPAETIIQTVVVNNPASQGAAAAAEEAAAAAPEGGLPQPQPQAARAPIPGLDLSTVTGSQRPRPKVVTSSQRKQGSVKHPQHQVGPQSAKERPPLREFRTENPINRGSQSAREKPEPGLEDASVLQRYGLRTSAGQGNAVAGTKDPRVIAALKQHKFNPKAAKAMLKEAAAPPASTPRSPQTSSTPISDRRWAIRRDNNPQTVRTTSISRGVLESARSVRSVPTTPRPAFQNRVVTNRSVTATTPIRGDGSTTDRTAGAASTALHKKDRGIRRGSADTQTSNFSL